MARNISDVPVNPPYMNRPRKFQYRILSSIVVLFLCVLLMPAFGGAALYADSVGMYESELSEAEAQQALEDFLNKFDPDAFTFEDETEGFHFYVSSDLFSAYHYNIYGVHITSTIPETVIRLEGDTGDVQTLSRILEQENIIKAGSTLPPDVEGKEPVPLEPKSHWISQSLNWVAPWLSVLHASWNSPRLSTGQTLFRFCAYFLMDGLMLWAGGTGLWSGPFDLSENGGAAAAAMLLPRIYGSFQHANLIRGHNRIAEMGYTFYIDL